eukprot:COSAG05_NODE_22576_length_264_cov_0.600000_1_plen_47_part_01
MVLGLITTLEHSRAQAIHNSLCFVYCNNSVDTWVVVALPGSSAKKSH